MKKVSIGVPVYNGAVFLEETLDSLLSQTFENIEVVISDNASTDSTENICRAYARRDSRVSYYRNESNYGAAWNYNRVFELSVGEYFKWAAADDLCKPNYIRRCVEVFDHDPEVVLAYAKSLVIDENGKPVVMEEDTFNLNSVEIHLRFKDALSPMKLCHNPVFGVTRRDVLAKTNLIGSYLASDRVLVAALALQGRFYEVPEYLFMRRKHPGNIGTKPEDLEFYDPSLKWTFVLPEWRVLREHLLTVRQASVSFPIKIKLTKLILRWVISRRRTFVDQLKAQTGQIIRPIL